jgi:transcriptional regulator with XRE-family HTH domain
MSTFDKLTEQREVQRVTQRKMAKYLKCTQSTLCRYENGKRKISAEMQDEYADKLGIELKLMIK